MGRATSWSRRGGIPGARWLAMAVLAGGIAGVVADTGISAATARTRTVTVVHTIKSAKDGRILVNAKGFALYTYSKDSKGHSNCTGQCISLWPPLVVRSGVTPVGKGVSGLGVATRANGMRQVTYHGKPLYLFVEDKRAGQVTGQGVHGFLVARLATSSRTTTTTAAGGY